MSVSLYMAGTEDKRKRDFLTNLTEFSCRVFFSDSDTTINIVATDGIHFFNGISF
jgi:hypothetical protein